MELHPWNRGFEWRDHDRAPRTLSREQVRRFDDQGFVVVDHLVLPEVLADAVAEIDRFEAEIDTLLKEVDGQRISVAEVGAITFATHLGGRSSILRALTLHPALVGIVEDLVGPDARLYWDQAVYKKPEKPRRFPWHQDNGYAFVEPQQYLTIWLALTDATLDNGCPQIVPGIHRLGTLAHRYVEPLGWECFEDPPEVVATPLPAGGAVVFSSLTPHLTGPNTTDDVRKAYIIQYAPDGAERLEGDPYAGPPTARRRWNDDEWQYPVLVGGVPAT